MKPDIAIENIKAGFNPVFKELYGEGNAVLKEQQDRYVRLVTQFQQEFGDTEIELFSSPGRTEIGGNHTDHNYGRVLAGAVNLDNIAVVSRNNSQIIQVRSNGFPNFFVNLDNLAADKWESYTSAALVKGICARLKELGYQVGGFNAWIDGRVPKGSGLSSSASFEVLIGAIISHLFNKGRIDPVINAQVGQWSENNYFGKPCGLMDQTACAVGGFIGIDFESPSNPVVQTINFDFSKTGYALVITDTGGNHANLNDEYASLPIEMKSVAAEFGADVLRKVKLDQIIEKIPTLRKKVSDRAILRALHFQNDNQRVADQVKALNANDFKNFLSMVIESGNSSYMYNQNIYPANNVKEQGVSIGLALSELVLKGTGAWRVHGGGFAGTIQAFVPKEKVNDYVSTLEHVFGKGKCHILFIRPKGAIKLAL